MVGAAPADANRHRQGRRRAGAASSWAPVSRSAASRSPRAAAAASRRPTPAGSATTPTSGSSTTTGGKLTGDLAVVALAASLENLAVQTYGAGISAATAGKLGTVPPAVVTFAQTAKAHHTQHAQAWNAVLSGAGKPL